MTTSFFGNALEYAMNYIFKHKIDKSEFNIVNVNINNNKCINIFFHGYTAITKNEHIDELKSYINISNQKDSVLIHWNSGNIKKTIIQSVKSTISNKSFSKQKISIKNILKITKESLLDATEETVEDFLINQNKSEILSNNINYIIDECYKYSSYDHINLIGHSLGGRIILNGLKYISKKYSKCIKYIVLMGCATQWSEEHNKNLLLFENATLFNLYSKRDTALIAKPDFEHCIGRNPIPDYEHKKIININCEGFQHTEYWPKFSKLCNQYNLLNI